MSKIETFTAPETIETIALSDLYLSDLNPRQEVAEEGIALLADSLVMCGLIQNLSGLRDKDGKVGIVAGGRRLRALNIAVIERADLAQVPVKVTDNPFVAEQWANAENTAREELDPVDEVRAYGKMAAKSLSVAKISNAFGVTEAHVRRRLALAGLPTAVLDALKAGEISMGLAKAMTVSTEEEKILEVLEQAKECRWFSEHDVKQALTSEAVSSTNRKAVFVGQEAYVEAGGTVTADLFADETLFNEGALLDHLFAEKLAAEAAKLREAEGWDWVDTHEDSYIPYGFSGIEGMHRLEMVSREFTKEQAERYDELVELYEAEALDADGEKELAALEDYAAPFYSDDQRKLSGVFVYVGNNGDIKSSSAYVADEHVQAAIEVGVLAPVKETKTKEAPKPAYSQKFIDDMVAIRLAAIQTALLDKPDYVLSLFAFSTTPASGLTSNLFGFGYGGAERNTPEIDDQFILDPRLGGERDEAAEAAYDQFHEMAAQGCVEAFKAFRDLGKKTRNGEITAFLARRFLTQSPEFMAQIEAEIGADMRTIWTPSAENCFKRLKGWQLDDLYKDLLELHLDNDMFKTFAKSKKGAKNEAMHKLFNDPEHQAALGVTEAQKAKIDAWVPDCF
ncbi:ParB/RepB/Spo0J family partition protein [Ruegeria lacuscaerulensis]|uniref:ParB/RepB/Spo0J family partition protein n=1 Tax=Ruegeria lacuscaerulensis TaxID=55218 RepID=UPI00147B9E1B|nr:ParB/RepB/Spo0J family partition protein [Ruegeria lacuscaerulensis]